MRDVAVPGPHSLARMTIAAGPLQDGQNIMRYLNMRFQRPGRDDGWIRPLGLYELSKKKHNHQSESDSLHPDHIHRMIPFVAPSRRLGRANQIGRASCRERV